MILLTSMALSGCVYPRQPKTPLAWENGLDVLGRAMPGKLSGKRIGLITNHSGQNRHGVPGSVMLQNKSGVMLVALFSPEHGLSGSGAAGEKIADGLDPATGLPVYSLYGERKAPSAEQLRDIDLLIFDMQDAGVRTFTYISTLLAVMQASAKADTPLMVLDRPNPLGGEVVEGPVLESAFESFVGAHPIALRHGMTIGELASMMNAERAIDAKLEIVRMRGWRRGMLWQDLTPNWQPPSPNLRSAKAALAYAGTVLFEGTNISEGRGTDAPFLSIGAPFLDGKELAAAMNNEGLNGVRFETIKFRPTASKFAGQDCNGVRLHITDPHGFHALPVALALLRNIHDQGGDNFRFLDGNPPFFDLLAGNGWLREDLLAFRGHVTMMDARNDEAMRDFMVRRARYLLY